MGEAGGPGADAGAAVTGTLLPRATAGRAQRAREDHECARHQREEPLRQWVLSLPFALRVPLAWHHDLALAVLGAAARAIEAFYRDRARALGIEHGRTGSITVIQRFGSDLALNVHFHGLYLDGVYDARGRFTPLPAPTRDEMHALTTRIAERITRLCERCAHDLDLADTERSLCAAFARSAARRGATAHAPEDAEPDTTPDHALRLKARVDGFDLDATTAVRAEDRERLEHLCRYLLRPPLADRRLRLLPKGQVALELKTPGRDGTRWLTMSADTFAAVSPRTRNAASSACARSCRDRTPTLVSTAECSPLTPRGDRTWCRDRTTTTSARAPRTPRFARS
jgi:hypothetical protein